MWCKQLVVYSGLFYSCILIVNKLIKHLNTNNQDGSPQFVVEFITMSRVFFNQELNFLIMFFDTTCLKCLDDLTAECSFIKQAHCECYGIFFLIK